MHYLRYNFKFYCDEKGNIQIVAIENIVQRMNPEEGGMNSFAIHTQCY